VRAKPISPGETLVYHLENRHWTQAQFAEVIGRPTQSVNEIIKDKKEITRQTAVQFAVALGTTPEYWLRLQDEYRLWLLEQKEGWSAMLAAIRKRARAHDE